MNFLRKQALFSLRAVGSLDFYKNHEMEDIEMENSNEHLIVTIVNKGYSEKVMTEAKKAGATGGTTISGRGFGENEATEREFAKVRAGKATPAILNDVRVDYYGTPTPISQVAKVSVPEPRMLLVTPWEKTMVDPIDKAILAANIGLTPMKDASRTDAPRWSGYAIGA
mgnify:CR=1 FL=1